MRKELEAAKSLAISAGSILMDHYSSDVNVEWKGPNDPVTAADREASRFLVDELKRLFPEDGVRSEEEHPHADELLSPRLWLVDPMDGTREFIAHRGDFSVMIGLAIGGIAVVGAVYQPTTGKLYYAASGAGAFLWENGATERLRVSSETDPAKMTIALSRSHHSKRIDRICHRLGIEKAIQSGSVGLKTGLICEQRAHLYINTGTRTYHWDTCAPEIILNEAGGKMTDLANAPIPYNQAEVRNLNGLIASAGAIHDRIVDAAAGLV